MFRAVLLILIGLALSPWPRRIVEVGQRRRAARLKDLKNGEPEAFFEERRSLEAYPVAALPLLMRIAGIGFIILGVVGATSRGI